MEGRSFRRREEVALSDRFLVRGASSAPRLGGRRLSAAIRVACDGRQLELYNLLAASSATAYLGDVGVLGALRDGGRLRKYRGIGGLYRKPRRIRFGKHPA